MIALISLIIIIGLGLTVFIFIIIKGIIGPKKIEQLITLLDQKKPALVIKNAKKLIATDPRNSAAHYILGKAFLMEENHDLALVEFRTVNLIGIFDSKYCQEIPFRKQMAELFLQYEQIDEALKEYILLAKLEPHNPEHLYNAGLLFEERSKTETAIKYYQKTIEVDKTHSDAHFRLGYQYYRQKKPVESKIELEVAIRTNPSNYNAHFYMGKLQKDSNNFSKALFHFEKAQKDPELKIKATVERGNTYTLTGKYEKAIPELQRAISHTSDDTSNDMLYARYYLAECFEKIRDIERAIDQWEKIYAKKTSFLDVAEKLSQYQELRTNDRVKDYLTSNSTYFVDICKSIVSVMNLDIRETTELINGCQIIAVEAESKWRNARKMPRLIRFYRISNVIRDSTIRAIHEEMKKLNVTRGIIFTSSSYSKLALDFAETRPIDLYDREQLQDYLNKITHVEKTT